MKFRQIVIAHSSTCLQCMVKISQEIIHKLERWTRRIWEEMSNFYLFLRSTKIAEIFTRHCAYVGECVVKISRKIVHKQQRSGLSKLGGGGTFIARTLYIVCYVTLSAF